MKIHIRIEDSNAAHTRLTVFLNGANTGTLCMRTEDEVVPFLMLLRSDFSGGRKRAGDSYLESGCLWPDRRPEKISV
jgi:hypothetical protein